MRAAGVFGNLAVAAAHGVPLADELDALAETLLRTDRRRVHDLADRLRAGFDPASALRQFPGLAPDASLPVLAAGAAAGALPRALRDEADRLTRRTRGPAGRVFGAAFYLGAAFTCVLATVFFVLYAIVPRFKKIFEDFGVPLPDVTRSLVEVGDMMVTYFWLPVGPLLMWLLTVGLLAPGWVVLRHRGVRLPWEDAVKAQFGSKRRHAPRLLRCLAAAAERGRPFADVLGAYADHAETRGPALMRLAGQVDAGAETFAALRSAGLLSRPEAAAARAASLAGNLPAALRLLADRAESARTRRLAALLSLAEPFGVVVLGLFVLWVAVAIFAPVAGLIYDLG